MRITEVTGMSGFGKQNGFERGRGKQSTVMGGKTARLLVLGGFLALAAGACDDGPASLEEGAPVGISFQAASLTSTQAASLTSTGASAPATTGAAVAAPGTLELSSVHLVVDEFKLEGNEGACEVEDPVPDCAKFEVGPHLLAIPLTDEDPEPTIHETAPAGSFTSLKFETKAVAGNAEVLTDIENEGISDWPSDASLLVTGEFTPEGETESESVRVYFDAEVKIVLPLPDPLVLVEGDDIEQMISIEVHPDLWFETEDGGDMDLRELDYDATGQVHPLEVKLEDGFTKIEVG